MSSRSFRLLPAAEQDANDAFDWYRSQRSGLGDEFRTEVNHTLDRIEANPRQFTIVLGTRVRRARLNRFPYSIFFSFEGDSIDVLAIFHEKRNPIIWRGRID